MSPMPALGVSMMKRTSELTACHMRCSAQPCTGYAACKPKEGSSQCESMPGILDGLRPVLLPADAGVAKVGAADGGGNAALALPQPQHRRHPRHSQPSFTILCLWPALRIPALQTSMPLSFSPCHPSLDLPPANFQKAGNRCPLNLLCNDHANYKQRPCGSPLQNAL